MIILIDQREMLKDFWKVISEVMATLAINELKRDSYQRTMDPASPFTVSPARLTWGNPEKIMRLLGVCDQKGRHCGRKIRGKRRLKPRCQKRIICS